MSVCRFVVSVWAITAAVIAASEAKAAEPIGGPPDETRTVTFVLENDVFYDTDRHYTNGVRIGWAGSPRGTPSWARKVAGWIPFFDAQGDLRTLYTVGQNIYTPNDITLVSPPLDDRPYAGWSYGSVGLMKSGARHRRRNAAYVRQLWRRGADRRPQRRSCVLRRRRKSAPGAA